MSNNDIVKIIKPLIFIKKLNNNIKTIPLNKIKNTLGPVRYFPPVNQEWYDSIYTYNSIFNTNIIIANKNLTRLIKSYFNLYFNKKLFYNKRTLTRLRRLAINKIFISKAELKHTSSKVIVTLYVYNEEKRILFNRLKRIEAILFPHFNSILNENYENKILSLKDKLNNIKKWENISFLNWLEEIKNNVFESIKLKKKVMKTIHDFKIRSSKSLEIELLEENIKNILSIIAACKNDPIFLKNCENKHNKFINKTFLEKEIIIIAYYKLLLNLNKYKFEDKFLLKLKPLLSKIYNKEIQFNIINLKAIYLNSDIFTQAISLKLRNRNNRLLKVLRYFLYMVKLPKVNVLRERFTYVNINNLLVNKVKNLTIDSNMKIDSLNQLLISIFTNSNFLKKLGINESYKNYNKYKINSNANLLNYILNMLRHKNMAGVRLEARGRLTRRFTASRSVFKIKWKGSLKNIDSSYRGLSSVILKGHLKSNVQYSIVNSKTRNGAFGIKGWISGK
jgi:Mitochondrial ribosomal protein (VAR1)